MTRRRLVRVVLPAALVLALAAPLAGSAGHQQGGASFAFGRRGGNIEPFRVTIARTGAVSATGAIRRAGLATRVSPQALDGLLALARAEGFFGMQSTLCRGSLPDFSSSYITVTTSSASRTLAVRGSCNPAFQQLYAVLSAVARAS